MSLQDDLLVFGYSCKLFRDDEKALFIDQGKHLVPWMNNPNLLIDRFDVRGALYDLTDAESKGTESEPLSEVEQKEDYLCEQERYFYLYHDASQQISQEEEIKRLQVDINNDGSYYNQVGFDYTSHGIAAGQPPHNSEDSQINNHFKPMVDEETYIPPPELNVPDGMEVPQTVKQNKIIIKTAKFIVTHGAQMEIVIKTKQSGNSFFNFLSFEHPLNAYYKHLVFMLRMGKYKWEEETENEPSKDQDNRYLHPDLSQSVRPDLTPGVSSPPASTPHCAYSKLITKIREKQIASGLEETEVSSPVIPSSPVVHSTLESTPGSQLTSVIKSTPNEPSFGLVDYPSFSHTVDGSSDVDESESPSPSRKAPSRSNSLRMQTHDYSKIKWPPPEIQMVIDKMASYITKNGSAFEEVVRNRDDPRFAFLRPNHEFYPYYQCKIQLYSEVYGDFFKNCSKNQDAKKKSPGFTTATKREVSSKLSSASRTICFSIKSREHEVPLTNNTTFPIESSTSEEDEEMDEEERERKRYEREQRHQARKRKEREEKERREQEEVSRKEKMIRNSLERKKHDKFSEEETSGNEDLYDIFKYAQEMENEKSRLCHSPSDSVKQLERKKKAAAFLSKISKGGKKDKKSTVYGPSLPPDVDESPLQSPSSRSSSEDSSSKASSLTSASHDAKRPPLPPSLPPPLPPPPPTTKSPSPLGLNEALAYEQLLSMGTKSTSPKLRNSKETPIPSITSVMVAELKEDATHSLERGEARGHKSRPRHKRSRAKSSSRSPSIIGKKEKKKRKRSHGRSHHRKKQRSRSRSRSKGHSKSHRSSHKKKSKHSSHKEKNKKKKHRRRSSSSSASSLSFSSSGSRSASPSSPSSLIFNSDSDADVQVIESQEPEGVSSRSSSVVSLPSSQKNEPSVSKNGKTNSKLEESSSGCEEKGSSWLPTAAKHSTLSLIPKEERKQAESKDGENKAPFDPSTSNAVAKITQGLRAKLHALLEK